MTIGRKPPRPPAIDNAADMARFQRDLQLYLQQVAQDAIDIAVAAATAQATADSKLAAPVQTTDIASGAVTQAAIASTAGSVTDTAGNWLEIQTITLTTVGGSIIVLATAQIEHTCDYEATNNAGGKIWGQGPQIKIERDGNVIYSGNCVYSIPGYKSGSVAFVGGNSDYVAVQWLDVAPAAGSHTYKVYVKALSQWTGATNTWATVKATNRSLSATELKR